jgi:aryl-alcohol dehydrogenase-like predicted oxidoreductase
VGCESEDVAFEILNKFAEVGGNFIDTANMYGTSEQVLGR